MSVEQTVQQRPPEEREELAQRIADRLDAPMTALGVVFLLLVLAETVSAPRGAAATALTVTSWGIWAAFVGEFALRLYIAPDRLRFLRRNGWQLVFLVLPFFRFVRILARLRLRAVLRGGRVLSSAIRGTRTASRKLGSRLAWLAVVTVIVVLAASQLLYLFGDYDTYALALHDAAYGTITGEPLSAQGAFARTLEVLLALYSVVVFATLAGTLGAFFLERHTEAERASSVHSTTKQPAKERVR